MIIIIICMKETTTPFHYVASSLDPNGSFVDRPTLLTASERDAIIHQLVLPFGDGGKVEPAIHIFGTAVGYRKVFGAIAEAMQPNGTLTATLAAGIAQGVPDLSPQAAMQSALSYTINRRNEALGIVEACADDGELIQTAVDYSARLIDKSISPDQLPVGKAGAVMKDKTDRMETYIHTPLPFLHADGATHALAVSVGHVPLHDALAHMFVPDSPLASIIAEHIMYDIPDVSEHHARRTAEKYLEYWNKLATFDVRELPAMLQATLEQPTPDIHAGTAYHQGYTTGMRGKEPVSLTIR
jgi:hypothetical protein